MTAALAITRPDPDAVLDRTGTAGFLAGLRAVEAMRAEFGPGMKRALFDHILRHPFCTMPELIEAIYPNADTQPDCATWAVQVSLCHARQRLAPHGYTIEGNTPAKGRYHLRRLA